MKRKMWKLAWALIPTMLIGACTYDVPDDAEAAEEQLASVSQWDVNTNFSSYTTVAIPDTIYELVAQGDSIVQKPVTGQYAGTAQQILEQVKKNLTDYGYTVYSKSAIPAGTTPDLAVSVMWTKVTNTTVYYNWWYYYDYWWDWWDWYYPPYYPYPYYPDYFISSYSTGNLIMNISDVKNAPVVNGKTQQRVVWNALVRSILDGTSFTQAEVNGAINDCFTQTPLGGHK